MIVGGIMHVFSAFLTGVIPCPEVWLSSLHMNLFPGLLSILKTNYKVVFLEEGGVCHGKRKPTLRELGLVIKGKIIVNHEIIPQSSARIALNK